MYPTKHPKRRPSKRRVTKLWFTSWTDFVAQLAFHLVVFVHISYITVFGFILVLRDCGRCSVYSRFVTTKMQKTQGFMVFHLYILCNMVYLVIIHSVVLCLSFDMEKSEEMVTLTMFSLLLLYSLLKVCQKLQENECLFSAWGNSFEVAEKRFSQCSVALWSLSDLWFHHQQCNTTILCCGEIVHFASK